MRSIFGFTLLAAFIIGAQAVGAAQTLRWTDIRPEPVQIAANLVPDPGFERKTAANLPEGWIWDRRNTDASCMLDTRQTRSGRHALKLTNGTPFGAHVYGTLWRTEAIRLTPGKPYTLSAWTRSFRPGIAWIGGGSGWQYRLALPPTGGVWRRVWLTFTPSEADRDFVVRIVTESPNEGVWLDDVKLEEGAEPTPVAPSSNEPQTLQLSAMQAESEIEGDGAFDLSFPLLTPRPLSGNAQIILTPENTQKRVALRIPAGAWRIRVTGIAAAMNDSPKQVRLILTGSSGERIAMAEMRLRFYSASNARARLQMLRRRLPALRAEIARLQPPRNDPSYPMVTFTVLENFVGFVEEDIQRKEVRRALMQLGDLEKMASRLERDLPRALNGTLRYPFVPRKIGSQRSTLVEGMFYAPTAIPNRPSVVWRPVFFNGYGHFTRIRADMERFPQYGVNIVQVEFGPSSIFPREGEVSDAPVKELLALLDRAEKAGVAVNLLISPHYLPDWIREKYPSLRKRREGFIQYSLYAPESKELLKRYIALCIPPLKDHPALHSICLSNEPVNVEEPGEHSRADWLEWLKQRYSAIENLNRRWGASYARFEDVTLPDPFAPARYARTPLWTDYIRFNQEWFAGWHAMLASAIREAAPDLPIHAKAMTWTLLNDADVIYGVDAYLFSRFSDINGNDSVNFYAHGTGEFAQSWLMNAMGHDLQRSVRNAPVFNSENHLIVDRETRYIPAEHIRSALWQAAIHGQSATTIWVWERSFDPKSDFAGSIMHRPACAEAVGIVNHDLNRAAWEVTAIQQAAPQVLLLQSVSAMIRDGGSHTDCRDKLYIALAFLGIKTGFVTERQLEEGILPNAPVLFIPNVVHLSEKAMQRLREYRGRLVFAGEGDILSRDEYGAPHAQRLTGDFLTYRYGKTTWQDLWKELAPRLERWRIHPTVELRDTTGKPVWGVTYRSGTLPFSDAYAGREVPRATVVNLCNVRHQPVTFRLMRNGQPITATDVLTGERVTGTITLQPLEVKLIRLLDRG
jgi:hypothetical protein